MVEPLHWLQLLPRRLHHLYEEVVADEVGGGGSPSAEGAGHAIRTLGMKFLTATPESR
jgi:hypothetical protein